MAIPQTREERLKYRIEKVSASLEQYYEAELQILGGAQQYSLGSRSLTRANLDTIRKTIKDLENLLDRLNAELKGKGRNLQVGIIPLDT